jgi:uncharacterized membrane protein
MKRILSLMMVLSLWGLALAPFPQEAQGLRLATAYPSLEVEAGESLAIDLELTNSGLAAQRAALEVAGLPEGWTARFQGGARVIHSVYVDGAEPRPFKLNLEVPAGAAAENYQVEVVARGQDATARLPLELIVGEGVPAALRVEAELPTLRGAPNATFTYRVKVTNDAEEDVVAALSSEAPQGFRVTFRTSGQEVTSVPVPAGQTKTIDVQVRGSETLAAGEYPLTVHVQAGEMAEAVPLTAELTGEPELAISGLDGRLSGRANAGRETPLELVVSNTGTAPAENLKLEASPPASWNVTFDPELIPVLAPNEQAQVVAHISPPQQAVAGDYMLGVRVIPDDGTTEAADLRITVTTSTLWGVVGLVLIAAALGVVAVAVMRFGRR